MTTPLTAGKPVQLSLRPGLGVHAARTAVNPQPARRSPAPVKNLAELLVHRAEKTPDATAFYFLDLEEKLTQLTYRELVEGAYRAAHALSDCRVRQGEPVIVSFDTGPEFLCAFFGCNLLGATPVPAYPPAGASTIGSWQETLRRMMERAGSRAAFVDPRLTVATTAVVDGIAGGVVLSEFPDDSSPLPMPNIAPTDLAFMQFTSGTTASPKGVMVPNTSLLTNGQMIADTTRWTEADLVSCWLPLYHDMGLVGCVLSPLLHGIPTALMPPLLFLFHARCWLWAIHHFRATLSPAPNFGYALCVDRIREEDLVGLDLSSWRVAYNGAEFVHADTVRRFNKRFIAYGWRPETMYPVYGMAETVLAATFPRAAKGARFDVIHRETLVSQGRAISAAVGDADAAEFVGVGQPFPGHEIVILDEDGKVLPERRQGQIMVRGPSLSSGYINDPVATAAAFGDGGLRTGDLGYLADGELFVCGRSKDLIIRAGRNYHPHDIELAASRVPGVRVGNVAAFAAPNVTAGTEDIVVLVETKVQDAAALKKLVTSVEAEVARTVGIRPDKVVTIPPRTLPKTSSGKIQRQKAQALYLKEALRPGGRGGEGRLATVLTLARTYLRFGLARARRLPAVGRLVNTLFPPGPRPE
jgi:fatty-acyl-CoA synthase